MSWFLNSTWRWFKWICCIFFYGCFLKLNIIILIIAYFLLFLILFEFLFSKITFKLYLRLDKRLRKGIAILQLSIFNLINDCYWTFWYRRVILFCILLFNWCEMALSQIILIVWSKCLYCLIIFLLLRRLYFEVLIIILSCILILCIVVNRLVLFEVLVFMY